MQKLDRRGFVGVVGMLGLSGLALGGCGDSDAQAESTAAGPATHSATRIIVDPDLPYEKLIARLEATVPVLPVEQMQAELKAGRIDAVRTLLQDGSPVGLYRFYALDITPFMTAAGHPAKAKSYLIGNPLIAEKMFAHDPAAMLYAPLRMLIHTDADNATHLTLDRPSDLFSSLGNPDIAATGRYLDKAVAMLLSTMNLPVPAALSA